VTDSGDGTQRAQSIHARTGYLRTGGSGDARSDGQPLDSVRLAPNRP